MLRYHTAAVSVSLLALTLALAGCNKSSQDMAATSANSADSSGGLPALPAALPMQTGPASQLTTAPPVAALPVRRYVGLSRPANDRQAYAYLDRASDIEDEIGDAPPDYDYHNDDGVSPWVWQTNGGDYRYAEPSDEGYRYYYYQPGENYPYLVRTHDRSYAYAGGALVAIYALSGALLPPDQYGGYRDEASRYFWRGQQLHQSAAQHPHEGVVAANWAAQRQQFSAAQANWAAARAQQPAWQSYHAQNDPSQQPGWQQEHQQRQQVAQQFSGWQSRGLAGSPPPALAAVGAHASPGRPGDTRQPAWAPANGHAPGMPGQQGFARPGQPNRPDMGHEMGGQQAILPNPNAGLRAAAAHDQHLAAEQQALASQKAAQDARMAQHQAAAQHEAVAKQQMIASVHRQQDMAAQQQVAGRLQAQQQHEALMAAHQSQLHALAAQREAEVAKVQASRAQPEALVREHAHPEAPGHENDHRDHPEHRDQ